MHTNDDGQTTNSTKHGSEALFQNPEANWWTVWLWDKSCISVFGILVITIIVLHLLQTVGLSHSHPGHVSDYNQVSNWFNR